MPLRQPDLLETLCRLNGRVTPEMLDRNTYNLAGGEWDKVCAEYADLERKALRQYISLDESARDAYNQIILFPAQLMANLYDMYHAQAKNHALYAGDPEANIWSDRVEECFARDAALMDSYNKEIAGGKWDGMMRQKHIGYTSWNDAFPADKLPEIKRITTTSDPHAPGYVFTPANGYAAIEAPHFHSAINPAGASWTCLKNIGRTRGGMSVMPYTADVAGSEIRYAVELPADTPDTIDATVVVKSTLAFSRLEGHRFAVCIEGCEPIEVNFNNRLNEAPENVYNIFYPTVARRVVENKLTLPVPASAKGKTAILKLMPLDPGVMFEKIVLDFGGYTPGYLHGDESPRRVTKV